MTWLPDYERTLIMGKSGRPLLGYTHKIPPNKLLLHTTEGPTAGGAISHYRSKIGIQPHLTVDYARDECHQHIPLDRASYSIRKLDQSGVVQVEIVGYAGESCDWDDDQLQWLARRVAAPIVKAVPTIPLHAMHLFMDSRDGTVAGIRGIARLTKSEWTATTGIVGHQHAPYNYNWDPGRIPIERIIAFAKGEEPPPRKSSPRPKPKESKPKKLTWADRNIKGVKSVQKWLSVSADGKWGPKTDAAFKERVRRLDVGY